MATRVRSREDWLRAARLALLHRGPDGVRVEPLARALGVTKGSFYWHFKDRGELMEALLREWEDETRLLTDALASTDPRGAILAVIERLAVTTRTSERGESPSDAAIFAWAATDRAVARRAHRAERERMALFRRLTGRDALADLFYYAYHGFLLRRRRVPAAAGDFEIIARLARRTFTRRRRAARLRVTRLAGFVGVMLAAALLHGCTTMRIIRHRDPDAARPRTLFRQRVVHRAEHPSALVTANPPRTDLDTVTVRDADLHPRSFAEYLERRHVRAFIVVRDDTVLYERYREGYGPATLSSGFSVSKSVTSALLGLALRSGAIRSLDDSVTRYIPELSASPAYRGVTLRHLLGMASGAAYTRTNGHAWHDLWSGDARFYYSGNFEGALRGQEREDPPGFAGPTRTATQSCWGGCWPVPPGSRSPSSWSEASGNRWGRSTTRAGTSTARAGTRTPPRA